MTELVRPPETESRHVGVILERRKLDNPWVDHSWRPVQVLPGVPDSQPWTKLAEGENWVQYYAGAAELVLYRHESETYAYNIESAKPAVWLFLRNSTDNPLGIELHGASVDPGEAHAHNDTGDDIVDFVAMPDAILEWVTDYVRRHPPTKEHYKRKRDRANPEALARRTRLYESDPLRQVPEDE